MKQLPEKWAIKTDDPEFWKWINQNVKPKKWPDYTKEYGTDGFKSYAHYPIVDSWGGITSNILESGYEEITIEQWREAVLFDLRKQGLNIPTPEDTGELIGYEVPCDIPEWYTKKGDIWVKADNWYTHDGQSLPAQWVETWKPVYKAKEKKRVVKSYIDIYEDGKLWAPYPDKKEAIEAVKKDGKIGCKYTYHEVDYITEE